MIGVITTSYPRDAGDWAGGFVRDRVCALVEQGAAVEVLAAGAAGASGWATEGKVRVMRVAGPAVAGRRLFYDGGAPDLLDALGPAAALAAWGFAAQLAAAAALRAPGWEAVETHWLVPCGLIGAAVAGGRSHRAFAHGGDVALLERLPGGDSLARALGRSGTELGFASADLATRFARLCGGPADSMRLKVTPAPFDANLFRPPSAEHRAELRRRLGCAFPTVLAVARLVPVKGLDLLVRAVSRLHPARRPALVVAGEGPERSALERLAAERRLPLRLLGAIPPAAVADWMSAAHLCVQPSRVLPGGRGEGMPVAVRQSLAVGTPVIASASGGLADMADPLLTLVPPGDVPALAAALARALRRV